MIAVTTVLPPMAEHASAITGPRAMHATIVLGSETETNTE
jgi:hypothetical protein